MNAQDLYSIIGIFCVIFLAYISLHIKPESIDLRDIMFFVGIAFTGIGAFMVYEPAGFIVSGLVLIWVSRPR